MTKKHTDKSSDQHQDELDKAPQESTTRVEDLPAGSEPTPVEPGKPTPKPRFRGLNDDESQRYVRPSIGRIVHVWCPHVVEEHLDSGASHPVHLGAWPAVVTDSGLDGLIAATIFVPPSAPTSIFTPEEIKQGTAPRVNIKPFVEPHPGEPADGIDVLRWEWPPR